MTTPHWPGVGKVDLEICAPNRTWIECKWADLWNCPWDLAKMALAVRQGLCVRAYLLAAAPAQFLRGGDGSEFFAFGEFDAHDDVLLRYRRYWLKWKGDVKTRPLRLPAQIKTHPESQPRRFRLASGEWELRRMVEVLTPGDDWIEIDEDRRPRRFGREDASFPVPPGAAREVS